MHTAISTVSGSPNSTDKSHSGAAIKPHRFFLNLTTNSICGGLKMKNILMIVGSLKKNSFNRQLAQEIESTLEGRANISYLE